MLFVAAKFSQEEMPKIFDPGPLQDLRPQDFIVVPRHGTEDVAFVATLEHKSQEQVRLRTEPFPRVVRRATEAEVEAWWARKAEERRILVACKEKAAALRLDMKITHARIVSGEERAIFHFTSEQRVDFRQLVKELTTELKLHVELWQIGVRDEARFVDGFGVCGLKTCCSTWLTEFRPITIKMAKDQDINLPPVKLSGQCGRLLCCLSYEADQYREMAKGALPKGATVEWAGKRGIIIDRNLIAKTYLVMDEARSLSNVKADEIKPSDVQVPDQMRQMGRRFERPQGPPQRGSRTPVPTDVAEETPAPESGATPVPEDDPQSSGSYSRWKRGKDRGGRRDATPPPAPRPEAPGADGEAPTERPRQGRRDRGRGNRPERAASPPEQAQPQSQEPRPPKRDRGRRGGPRPAPPDAPPPPQGGDAPSTEGDQPRQGGRRGKRKRGR